MKNGLLWFDHSGEKTVAQKIQAAVRRYQEKYGTMPNIVFVNPSQSQGGTVDGVTVKTKDTIMPNHFWLGCNA